MVRGGRFGPVFVAVPAIVVMMVVAAVVVVVNRVPGIRHQVERPKSRTAGPDEDRGDACKEDARKAAHGNVR